MDLAYLPSDSSTQIMSPHNRKVERPILRVSDNHKPYFYTGPRRYAVHGHGSTTPKLQNRPFDATKVSVVMQNRLVMAFLKEACL